MSRTVEIPKEKIAELCRRHHIRSLALFGSALHGNLRPESDIDFLVAFAPEHIPGLLEMARLEHEPAFLLGCPADLRTREDLSRYFREDVFRQAEVCYSFKYRRGMNDA